MADKEKQAAWCDKLPLRRFCIRYNEYHHYILCKRGRKQDKVEKSVKQNNYFLSKQAIRGYFEKYLNQEKDSWEVFVLINRKGYWDYRVVFPDASRFTRANERGQIVVSDRLLEKLPNEELNKLLKGKKVIVYDDSLTNGANLFFYYLLCRYFGARSVVPVVYALNTEFPSQRSRQLMLREAGRINNSFWEGEDAKNKAINEFETTLSYQLLLGNSDIDRMSVWQTRLFQKELSPLVMDLPILNHVKESKEKKIKLTRDQFRALCADNDPQWNFVENEVYDGAYTIQASYFHFQSQLLNKQFKYLFHDFVVKCKYEKKGDAVFAVFTPFAIVKSITFENAFRCFKLFYKDTIYGMKILHYFPGEEYSSKIMEEDHNLCRALFRAVIFRLSDYIGRKFQQYVDKILGIELEYDWNIMEDNFDYDFIKTQLKLYDEFNEEQFRKLVYRYVTDSQIDAVNTRLVDGNEKSYASLDAVKCYVKERIIGIKYDMTSPLEKRIYTLETMEEELEDRFYFEDEEMKRRYITCTVLSFLETNIFSNLIFSSNKEHVLYRGFRYGENSEILLHEDLWFFYAHLYAYYVELHGTGIKENYSKFMNWLETYLIEKEYMGLWISETGFHFLKNYFGKESEEELGVEIKRRRYWVDSSEYGEENAVKLDMLAEAANSIKRWGRV